MGGGMEADPLIRSSHLPLEGVVDYLGRPLSSRSTSGGWTSALFVIGVETAERCAYFGVSSNLITYLTGPLGQSTASAAANVNAWSGAAMMLPLLGGFLADSYVGRYRTIAFVSPLYVLGLGMLTLSATVPPLRPPQCRSSTGDPGACRPTTFSVAFFFISIYLVAFAQGGFKPCVQAFGADQFDENDPEERESKSSFFNWWFFGLSFGIGVTHVVVNYAQDSIGWGMGFGLPCASMAVALAVFLMGTRTYRYYPLTSESPFTELAGVCAALWRRPAGPASNSGTVRLDVEDGAKDALVRRPHGQQESRELEEEGEDAQGVLRLFPIGATCLVYAVVYGQPPTLFTKQGSTMDRRLGPSGALLAPPAALQSLISLSIVTFLPIYDRVVVPLARKLTGVPTGVTMLQRIGIGMVVSIGAMVVAALVEMKRLQTARDFGLVDLPEVTVPMSLWWLVPQYVLYGVSEVFVLVGLQEFFYDQVPDGLRSLGLALYLSIFGIGGFLSSFLVSVIDRITTRESGDMSWFCNNLNRAHLDYFYWLLAGLSVVGLLLYLCFARVFQYKKKGNYATA